MRLIFSALSIIVLLIVGAFVGPSFIDWNKHKPTIIAQVKNASGLNVKIDGDLSLGILPSPHVQIEGVTLVAPLQKNFENILTVKSAEVSVQLMPLFKKEIKVSSISLIAPDISIEIMQDGTPSWTTSKIKKVDEVKDALPEAAKENVKAAANDTLEKIAFDKVNIEKGQLKFINHQTGANYTVNDINIDLKANSLKGPFDLTGDLVYQDNKVEIDTKTGRLPKGDEGLTLDAKINLPDADASFAFNGVSAITAPFDVQGKTVLNVKNPSKLGALTGAAIPMTESISLDGLLTANEEKASFNELKLSLGDFVGNGKLSIENIKSKNPLVINGAIKSASILDVSKFTSSNKTSGDGKTTTSSTSKKSSSLIPQTLTLPMAVNANVQFDLGGVKLDDKILKGVFFDANKSGKDTKISYKILELPGQAKSDGALNINYKSSSQSPKTGQVTLSDPSVTYAVNGQINSLAGFLKSFAPDADTSNLTKLYKTSQFNLKGNVTGSTVALKDSVLKLDNTVIGLGGSYKVPANVGRANASIEVSADTLDFDKIMGTSGKSSNGNGGASASSSKGNKNPLASVALPLDVTFDVSIQNAIYNAQKISGVRVAGSMIGRKLALTTAGVQDFAGATITAKGAIANIDTLTGMDVSLYTKTSNLKKLGAALKVDTSKLPPSLNALEATVKGVGSAQALNFDANINALGGRVDAKGIANDLLGTPSYKNLSLGLKHPNLVKAIQAVSPDFKGQAGLQQAINFFANADINGQEYALSNMKVELGKTNFGGNLNINAGEKPMSIKGNIAAGTLALDSLLGAKTSGSGGTSSKSASASSSERWSKTPIDLSWMDTINTDIDFKANAITYGAWNLSNPSTNLKVANGQMGINNMKVGVFGGSANMTTQIKSNPVSLVLKSDMNGIDLERLVKALSGSSKLKTTGAVDFDLDIKSSGASSHALVNALNGSANLNGTDITFIGFDLAKMARGLAVDDKLASSFTSLVEGATRGGQTKFDTVKGVYKITNGVVNIDSMVMDSSDAVINTTGNVSFPRWYITANNQITLKSVPDLKPFNVEIKGPLDNPKDTFGKNILEDYLKDKLKRKLGKELPNILGDKTTDKLKKFGIVGEEGGVDLNPESLLNNFIKSKTEPKAVEPVKEPAPAAPANDNPAPAKEEVKPAPTPEPVQEEPKKIKKPEDALKTILETENPEDAVNNLIKGLF